MNQSAHKNKLTIDSNNFNTSSVMNNTTTTNYFLT